MFITGFSYNQKFIKTDNKKIESVQTEFLQM